MRSIQNKTCNTSKGNSVVIGLGKSGIACATYLVDEGWDVEMADVKPHPYLERMLKSELPGIMVHDSIHPQLFINVDLVVMSCTAASSNSEIVELAQKNGARTVTSLELFFERSNKPVIAISGDNGKSTVTALVDAIIKRHNHTAYTDEFRVHPILELLNETQPDAYILEFSASQLEQMQSVSPDVATILNASQDHLKHYSSVQAYVDAMARVVKNAKISVINRDDPVISEIPVSGSRIEYGRSTPERDSDYGVIEDESGKWIVRGNEKLIDLNQCALKGSHNELNILAACAIADAAGYAVDTAIKTVTEFEGLQYSCDDEGEFKGVRWVNDARSTNVAAAIAAIESATEPVVLIAGGTSKGADFSEIPQKVNGKLRACILYGRDNWEIGESINGVNNKQLVEDIDDAIAAAEEIAVEGDCVVFSPGCDSYDMFTDYEHRGDAFSRALRTRYS